MEKINVGDKLHLYEIISHGNISFFQQEGFKGRQGVAISHPDYFAVKPIQVNTGAYFGSNSLQQFLMFSEEVKLIGTFVVKKIKHIR